MDDRTSIVTPARRRPCLLAVLLSATSFLVFGQTETILYTFQGPAGNDGYFPQSAPLVLGRAGNLYGTTTYGGGGPCVSQPYTGCGMIFQLTPPGSVARPGSAWTENVIWRFQGGADGGYPGGLLIARRELWGVAASGGTGACSGGCGYLFRLKPPAAPDDSWTKTNVLDFPSSAEACGITAVDADGNFYGVGGSTDSHPNGTVCKITRPDAPNESWKVANLYTFKGVANGESFGDGTGPLGVTFDDHGNLWGATFYGGYCQQFEGGSCFGTLFLLTPPSTPDGKWTEYVVHRFGNRDQNPSSGVVIDKAGALYGITYTETYKFLYGAFLVIGKFSDIPPNGYAPTGGVILDRQGNVYGTTGAGGQFGKGTVYKLTPPAYSQTILHSFAAGDDGWNPEAPMTLGPDALYGTTQIGGNQGCNLGFGGTGCGIVFRITPQ